MLQQTAGGWFEQCNMCRRVVEELLASSSAVARGSLDEIAEDETVAKSQALIQSISEAVASNWYLGGQWCILDCCFLLTN